MTAQNHETTTNDEHLVALIVGRGESAHAMSLAQAAMGTLYERHAGALLGFLASKVPRRDLEDVHHEVWLRVWSQLTAHYQDQGNFRSWLFVIARNASIDHNRKKRPDSKAEFANLFVPLGEAPDAIALERERREVLERCMAKLDAKTAALVRARLGNASYVEVCAALGISTERGHKLVHKAKSELQKCVDRALS